ncbi:unnamed protein product [Natator depressus]
MDASEVGLGEVFSQEVDGEEHSVLYLSRKLFPRERHYGVIENEALNIKWAIEAFRYYLFRKPFILITDHNPLKWLGTIKTANAWLMKWYLTLQQYAFTI